MENCEFPHFSFYPPCFHEDYQRVDDLDTIDAIIPIKRLSLSNIEATPSTKTLSFLHFYPQSLLCELYIIIGRSGLGGG